MDLTGAIWRKASRSGNNGGNCVEVARNLPGVVAVRDSKHRQGPVLAFTPDEWHAFTAEVKTGDFDLPE
jgi:hypothetical protein